METNSRSNSKRPFWILSEKEGLVALVLLTGLLIGVWLPERLIIATSDSLEYRVFFKIPANTRRIRQGDYLLFNLDDVHKKTFIRKGLKENNVLIKKVGCVPGETLVKDAKNTFFCQQTALGTAMKKDAQGKELPIFEFYGPIPEDNYYMMGTNPRSFDSRYFGLIHVDDFICRAIPIW